MSWRTEESEFEPRQGQEFPLLHVVQTHPTSYRMGSRGYFPGVKRQEREAEHLPSISAEVKEVWIYTYEYTPPHVFMA
jgi:hypothetical protein